MASEKEALDFLLLGPAIPYRGGIADTQYALAKSLSAQGYQVKLVSFSNLYPAYLFPGNSQFAKDSKNPCLSIERLIHAYNPLNWIRVAKRVRQLKPKVVVFRYWTPFIAPCWIAIANCLDRATKKVALVDNWHAHEPKPWDSFLNRRFEKSMDLFTTLSNAVASQIVTDSPKRVWGKMHPIQDDLPQKIEQNEAKRRLQISEDKTALLFFGLVRPYKGLTLLLKALKQHPEKYLFIVGECYESWASYQQLIEEYQIEKQITVVSRFVSHKEAALYFSTADATVLPYTSATQSGVLALAYHYETPLVVTDHPGLTQPVIEDQTGEVCHPTVEGVSEAISLVTEATRNKTYRKNLKENKGNYSWDIYAKEWAQFILAECVKYESN